MIDDEVRRELTDLLRGRTYTASTFDLLVAPAVSTTITKTLISSNSVVLHQAFSALALNGDINRIVPANGSFTVFHAASANARTYRYVVFTGLA